MCTQEGTFRVTVEHHHREYTRVPNVQFPNTCGEKSPVTSY